MANITYIYTQEGWLYLSTIMDLYSRKIVGWSMNHRITQELVMRALNMAIKQRNPSLGVYYCIQTGVVSMPAIAIRHCWAKEVSYVL